MPDPPAEPTQPPAEPYPPGAAPAGTEPVGAAPAGTERGTSVVATLKRTAAEFVEDQMSDRAAALTYYGLLSLFPALIALVSIVGLVFEPEQIAETLNDIVSSLGPDTAVSTFAGPVESVTESPGASGVALVISLGIAIWSASAYVGAFSRSSNVAWETREGRPFWKLRPFQMLVTLVMILILALLVVGLIVSGPLVGAIGDAIGVGSHAQSVWNIARWPVMILLALLLIGILFHTAPNVKHGGSGGSLRGPPSPSSPGLSLRSPFRYTSQISAPTTRPTERSADSSRCWSGSG